MKDRKLLLTLWFVLAAVVGFVCIDQLRERRQASIYDALALTAEQRREVDALHAPFEKRVVPICRQLGEARRELMAQVRQQEPEQARVDAALTRIGELRTTLQREIVDHLVQVGRHLSPAQRETMATEILQLTSHGRPSSVR